MLEQAKEYNQIQTYTTKVYYNNIFNGINLLFEQ